MGNAQQFQGYTANPISTEGLISAVKNFQHEKVEKVIEGGVKVNDPIDPQGHTILDFYIQAHKGMLVEMEKTSKSCDATTASRSFYEHQEAAFQTLAVLRRNNAVMGAKTAILKKGF